MHVLYCDGQSRCYCSFLFPLVIGSLPSKFAHLNRWNRRQCNGKKKGMIKSSLFLFSLQPLEVEESYFYLSFFFIARFYVKHDVVSVFLLTTNGILLFYGLVMILFSC
ncbi:hypothetical protein ACOSP7_008911 [Xanthoceras sorbifolium]